MERPCMSGIPTEPSSSFVTTRRGASGLARAPLSKLAKTPARCHPMHAGGPRSDGLDLAEGFEEEGGVGAEAEIVGFVGEADHAVGIEDDGRGQHRCHPGNTHRSPAKTSPQDLAREGMKLICVTHEMGFAREVADRVVFMADGQIVEVGTPEHFFESPDEERTKLFLSQIL